MRWIRVLPAPVWIGGVIATVSLLAILQLTCAPDRGRLPPAEVTRAETAAARHAVASAVDTAAIRQLREQAAAALAARQKAERGAAAARALADSLAAVARLQGDSAREWRGAYDARTEERDSLEVALARTDTALVRTDAALRRTEGRAARADSALAAALLGMHTVEQRGDQRGFWDKVRPKLCAGPSVQMQPSGKVTAGLSVGACWTVPP